MLRAIAWFTILGAVLGGVAGSFAGHHMALFWLDPGNNARIQAALCPCLGNARDAINTFLTWQLGCVAAGIVIVNIVGLVIRGKLVRRAAAKKAAQVLQNI